jgi:hypothetical protein
MNVHWGRSPEHGNENDGDLWPLGQYDRGQIGYHPFLVAPTFFGGMLLEIER